MIRHILFTLLMFSFISTSAQTEADARKLLDNIAATASSRGGLEITFTAARNQSGTLKIKGRKFILQTADVTTWYDGKTQWTYLKSTEEVTVSTPTAAEVAQINPQSWIQSYRTAYNVKYEGKVGTHHKIGLTPKRANGIQKIELQISSTTSKPTQIGLTMSGNKKGTFLIKSYVSKDHPDPLFRFNPKQYPNAEIIDLR